MLGEQIEDVWDKRLSQSRGGGRFRANGMGPLRVISCDAEASHLCAQEGGVTRLPKRQPVDGPRLEHRHQDNDVESMRVPIRVSSFSLPRTS